MGSFGRSFEKLVELIISSLLVIMVLLVLLQIASRYFFNSPTSWSEELARIIFIWIIFLGSFLAVKNRSHVCFEMFIKRAFNSAIGQKFSQVLDFLIIIFLILLIRLSIDVLQGITGSITPVLQISLLYLHAALPIAGVLMAFTLIFRLFSFGWKSFITSGLISIAIVAIIYLIFGINQLSPGNLLLISIISLVILIVIGMPIAFSLAICSTLYLVLLKNISAMVIPTRMIGGVDSFTLLAVPFFVLAGDLLNIGGVTQRLVDLAKVLVGSVRGGLGMVVVVGEYFFSGLSGAIIADVSALGSILIPAMTKAGYKRENSAAIVSAASAMGILVPPCILMIVLGGMTGISVGALFAGGFIPAIVLALCIMVVIYFQAIRAKLPIEKRLSLKESLKALIRSIIPLLCPIIIFGGILSGAATATEISVVAVAYAFIVGVFVYKEIKWKDIMPILLRTATTTGVAMLLVSTSSILSWIFATNQIPHKIGELIIRYSVSPFVFILLCNVLFILLGSVLEGMPAMLILVPIFLPLAIQLGIDPLHFGILCIASLGIGIFLPPVGMGILIACSFAKIDIGEVVVPFLPYLIVLLIGLIIISYFPWFTLILPNIFFPK